MERYYETILQCALVKLYPEQFSIVFFFFTLKLYSSLAIFDLEIFERSKGRKVCSRRNNLWNLCFLRFPRHFSNPFFFLGSSLLGSLIPRFAGVCVCVCSIDLWFINGISLGSWFVTAVVASFSLVITRYCRAKSN